MIEGESGLLSISPPWWRPVYVGSKRKILWPDGTQALLFSGDKPNQLRGPQFHKAWVDELAKMQYPEETWDNLELGLRLGDSPQVIVTTTPRPIHIVRTLLKDPQAVRSIGSSFENVSNLSPRFIQRVIQKYVGTRQGRQELFAEVLDDTPGALWTHRRIEDLRIRLVKDAEGNYRSAAPKMVRIVVAVDPAASSDEHSNETGIVVVGLGTDAHGYLLADLSGVFSPGEWGRRVVEAYKEWQADRIVGEKNNGGEMVRHTIHTADPNVPVRLVWASRGKGRRAEPISALTEQKRIHHVGMFAELEDQLTQLTPNDYMGKGSPDRADAYVWGFTELMIGTKDENDPGEWATHRR
jgi:phage terminase large subunit-like protein